MLLELLAVLPIACPPQEAEVPGRSLFADRDGQRIHVYEKVPADWREAAGMRTVVFVHGATWSGRPDFDLGVRDYSVMDAFVRAGWATYAVDAQGYGASDDPVGENWCEAQDAALDLAAAVELIRTRGGVQQVHLLGWSWGCQIVGIFAAEHPERVARLVLQGGHYKEKFLPEAPTERFRTNDAEGAASDFVEGCYEEDVVARYVEECLEHDPASPNGVFRDFTEGRGPLLAPEKLTMPTMLVFGAHELRPGRLEDATELFVALGAIHKRLLVLPGGGHAILLEKPHLLWQREVRRFFEEEWEG